MQSAIGSVAAAAEQAFLPYAERVLELMKSFMVLTNDEDLCSRARATELVGIVAMSVGRMRMEPILTPFIEAAITVITLPLSLAGIIISVFKVISFVFYSQGFGLEFSELREYTHGFFSNIAEILADGFVQVCMDGFVKLNSCGSFLVPMFTCEYLSWSTVSSSRGTSGICFLQSGRWLCSGH